MDMFPAPLCRHLLWSVALVLSTLTALALTGSRDVMPDPLADRQPITWSDPRIAIWGRFHPRAEGAQFNWPGFRVEFNFTGEALSVLLSSKSTARFVAIVDGTIDPSVRELSKGSNSLQLCGGLSKTQHTCSFMMISETLGTPIYFSGVILDGTLHQMTRRARRLEFYGDSDTAGFSIDGPYPSGLWRHAECITGAVGYTNTQHAWGVQLADHFGAQAQFMAISGVGLTQPAAAPVLNWLLPCPRLPECLDQAVFGDPTTVWDASQSPPDAIFLLVGANDFMNLSPPSDSDFNLAYTQFLTNLHSYHSSQPIPLISVCAGSGLPSGTTPGVGQALCPLLQNATTAFNAQGLSATAHLIQLPSVLWDELWANESGYTTCLDHWTWGGQQRWNRYVMDEVSQILRWGEYRSSGIESSSVTL